VSDKDYEPDVPDDDTLEPDPDNEDDGADGRVALARLYAADGPADMEVFRGPMHWPSEPAADVTEDMVELRAWVEELVERFVHLDHTVIPVCWWRHNSHVEALQALKDHERVSYADSANGTAAVEWHRAFLVIETRLREWTGWSGCASGHKDPIRQLRGIDQAEWEEHVEGVRTRREAGALRAAAQ
jgi:hypothetical protein